jgi:hypothetical protein
MQIMSIIQMCSNDYVLSPQSVEMCSEKTSDNQRRPLKQDRTIIQNEVQVILKYGWDMYQMQNHTSFLLAHLDGQNCIS